MPVLKVKNNGIWESIGGSANLADISASDIGALTIDLNDNEYANPPLSNSDMLGGIAAESYALKTWVQTILPQIHIQKINLSTGNWTASGNIFSQTVTVEKITTDTTKISVIVSSTTDRAMEKEYSKCEVRASSQGNGTLTFTCTSLPTINLEANVMVLVKEGVI